MYLAFLSQPRGARWMVDASARRPMTVKNFSSGTAVTDVMLPDKIIKTHVHNGSLGVRWCDIAYGRCKISTFESNVGQLKVHWTGGI